ncbi:ATP synthase F1 subunit delta [Cuneatibacter caecimuris]|uniref:ATP synthase subunit delta n=1 Tax=Cuneatibacter caecimuris TaxID=1796618 RepID=A0A4Q7P6F2_9FIRM|nr:ATP synthase F1 subunit delta [Cuneatibacter caecimuris]RZS94292.1 F-type H+-transporting ATPase subunit delta [Cuneatibacter caecimuris]
MTQTAVNYAKALYGAGVLLEEVEGAASCLRKNPQLMEALLSPVIPQGKKRRIIDRIFSENVRSFLKVLCAHHQMEEIYDISKAYRACCMSHEKRAAADLYYVTEPDPGQQQKMKEFLCRETGAREIELALIYKPELIGGFVLRTGDQEYDWSLKGRLDRLRQKLTWR